MNILTDLQSLTMIHMVLGKLDIHIQDKEGTPPPCTCTKISRKSRDIDTRCKIEESHEALGSILMAWHLPNFLRCDKGKGFKQNLKFLCIEPGGVRCMPLISTSERQISEFKVNLAYRVPGQPRMERILVYEKKIMLA